MSELNLAEHRAEYGSFKDSLRAPIHRWFMYPAGYSYRLVESKIEEYGLTSEGLLLDPFVGCGTTSVVAKQHGLDSIGIEAHPFVFWVAKTKLFWEYDLAELAASSEDAYLSASFGDIDKAKERVEGGAFPDLVVRCFSQENLAKLLLLRDAVEALAVCEEVRDFLKLALTHTLRTVSTAGTGWPYIAPSVYHAKTVKRDALKEFHSQARRMYEDIVAVRASLGAKRSTHRLVLGDARCIPPSVEDNSVDLVITSPPYLNNYDYADRTRLETYFFGLASSWHDITEQVRKKLIMSATTQVNRSERNHGDVLGEAIRRRAPHVHGKLLSKIQALADIRNSKGGKKSYDLMVAGYFEDMFKVVEQVWRVLKPGGVFVLVLGDSAPYGVYVPTDFIIGDLALAVGFESYQVEMLRTRGGKWAGNPQRHKEILRESIVTIVK